MNTSRFTSAMLFLVVFVLCPRLSQAANGTWTSTGSGHWSNTANWSGGTVADGSGSTAFFNSLDLTSNVSVRLDSPRTIGRLTFGDTGVGSPASWILNDNGFPTNILTLAAPQIITVNAMGMNQHAAIKLQIDGSVGLNKEGTGTLVLSGTNTYTGNTHLRSGTLQSGADDVLPDAATFVIGRNNNTDSTLDLNGFNETLGAGGNAIYFATLSQGKTARITSGSGTLTLGGNIGQDSLSAGLKIIEGNLSLGGGVRTISANGAPLYISATVFNGTLVNNQVRVILSGANIHGSTILAGNGTANGFELGADHVGTVGAIVSGPLGTGALTVQGINQQGGKISSDGSTPREILNPVLFTGNGNLGIGDVVRNGYLTFKADIDLINRTHEFIVNSDAQFDGLITGTGGSGFSKSGAGTLLLNGVGSTYVRNAGVSAGILRSGAHDVFPDTIALAIAQDGILDLNNFNDFVSGSGFSVALYLGNNIGSVGQVAELRTGTGTLTIGGNLRLDGGGGNMGDFLFRGNIHLGNATRQFNLGRASNRPGTLTVEAVLSGDPGVGLTHLGVNSLLLLTGINTYDGPTTISHANSAFEVGGSGVLGGGNHIGTINIANATADFNYNSTASQTLRGVIGGIGTVTKRGSGTLTLTTNNTFTGGMIAQGGVLTLDYSNTNTSRLADGVVLTLAGGTVNISGGRHYHEVVASTTLEPGASFVTRSDGSNVLDLAAITENGGTVDFSEDFIATTMNGLNSDGILGTWATVGGIHWATTNGAGFIVAYTSGYTDIEHQGSVITNGLGNVRINSLGTGGDILLSAFTTTVGSLQQNFTRPSVVQLTTNTFRTHGVMMSEGKGALTIGTSVVDGVVSTPTNSGSLTLSNFNTNGVLTINSPITDHSNSTLATRGPGSIVLNGTNTYAGDTGIGGGVLTIGAAGQLGGGTYAANVAFGSAGILNFSSTASNLISGLISGDGRLHQMGPGLLEVSGMANTYQGGTLVDTSTLIINRDLSMGMAPRSPDPRNLTLQNGAIIESGASTWHHNRGVYLGPGSQTIRIASGILAIQGLISGFGQVDLDGGDIRLGAANTHSGRTTVVGGTVRLNDPLAVQNSTLDVGAFGITFGVAGRHTLGGLQGSANINMNNVTLSVGNNNENTTYGGRLSGGNGTPVIKIGTGTWTLSGNNTYGVDTEISSGTLKLTGSLNNTPVIHIAPGAIFDVTVKMPYGMAANQTFTLDVDPVGTGTVGRIKASVLDVSSGHIDLNGWGMLNDPVYVLATYTSLVGTAFATTNGVPTGYDIEYDYRGEGKIALVRDGLFLTKNVDRTMAFMGEHLMYTIEVINGFTSAVGGIVVTDAIPAGVSFISSVPPPDRTNGNTYGYTVGLLESGSNAVITIDVVATSEPPVTVTNTAWMFTTNTVVNLGQTQDTAETEIVIPADMLALTKSVVSTNLPSGTSRLTYTITVTNIFSSPALGVVVTDSIPAGVLFEMSIPAPFDFNGNDLSFNLGVLNGGAGTSIVIEVAVTSTVSGTLTNWARVFSDIPELNLANNRDSAEYIFVIPPPMTQDVLALSKTVNATNLMSGESNLIYTINIMNLSTRFQCGVVVTDSLPAGVAFFFSVPAATETNGNEIVIELGCLPPGTGTSIVMNTAYTSSVGGITLTNWAQVSSTNAESVLTNNIDSALTTISSLSCTHDSDSDGMLDCDELIAGTDPFDPDSFLWVRIMRTGTQDIQFLSFPTATGRTYRIQSSSNLYTNAWLNVQTNIPGDGTTNTIPDSNGIDRLYYRIGVESP